MKFFYNVGQKPADAILVFFENTKFIKPLKSWQKTLTRPSLPFARTLTRAQMRALMAKNSILIDVRAPKDTENLIIPRSFRLPYLIKTYTPRGGYSFAINSFQSKIIKTESFQDMKKFFNFKQQQLKNPQRNIIVTCRNETDATCVRALTWFHFHGLKHLYWFRGGVFNWFSLLSKVPSKLENITSVNSEEVKKLIANKSTIIVNVDEPKYYQVGHIPGASNLPYTQPSTPQYYANNYAKIKNQLIKSGDFINISSLQKNSPIIVYAYDEYNWKASEIVGLKIYTSTISVLQIGEPTAIKLALEQNE